MKDERSEGCWQFSCSVFWGITWWNIHFTFFSPAGHDLAMAWAQVLYEPKGSGDTAAHPSVTQPPSNRRWPTELQGPFSDQTSLWQGREVLSPLYKESCKFPTRCCRPNNRRTELIPPSNPFLLEEPFRCLISKEIHSAQTLLKIRQKVGLEDLHAYVWSETGPPVSLISSKLRQAPGFLVEFQSNDKYSNLIPRVKNAVNCALAFNASCLEEIYQPNLV